MTQDLGILKQLLISSHKRNSNGYKYTCNLNGLEVAITIPMDKVEEVLAGIVVNAIANSPLQRVVSDHTQTAMQGGQRPQADAMQTGSTDTQADAMQTVSDGKQNTMQVAEKQPQNKTNKQVQDALARRLDELSVVSEPLATAGEPSQADTTKTIENEDKAEQNTVQSQTQDINKSKTNNNSISHSNTKVSTIVNTNYPTQRGRSATAGTVSDGGVSAMQAHSVCKQVVSDDKQPISNGTQTPTLKPIEEEQQTQTQQNTVQTAPTTDGGQVGRTDSQHAMQAHSVCKQVVSDDKQPISNGTQIDNAQTQQTKAHTNLSLLEIDKPTPTETINWQKLMDYWNSTAGKVCGRIQSMTEFRKNHIRKRIDEYGKDKFIEAISLVQQSEFLTGGNDKGWRADFDWMIRPQNFIKVLEGKYTNQKPNYNNGQFNSRGHPSPYANLSARLDSILAGKAD